MIGSGRSWHEPGADHRLPRPGMIVKKLRSRAHVSGFLNGRQELAGILGVDAADMVGDIGFGDAGFPQCHVVNVALNQAEVEHDTHVRSCCRHRARSTAKALPSSRRRLPGSRSNASNVQVALGRSALGGAGDRWVSINCSMPTTDQQLDRLEWRAAFGVAVPRLGARSPRAEWNAFAFRRAVRGRATPCSGGCPGPLSAFGIVLSDDSRW